MTLAPPEQLLTVDPQITTVSQLPTLDLPSLVEQLNLQIAQNMETQYSRLLLYQQEKPVLWSVVANAWQNHQREYSVERGLIGQVVQTGQAICLNNPHQDSRFNPQQEGLEAVIIHNLLFYPLFDSQQHLLGIVQVFNKPLAFTVVDEQRLGALCSLLAIILEQSQQTEQLQVSTESLRKEYHQLQTTYHHLEESHLVLHHQFQQQRRRSRLFILVILMVTGLMGIGYVQLETIQNWLEQPSSLLSGEKVIASKTVIVKSQLLKDTLHLTGKIEPLEQIEVISPVSGKVKEKLFQYNQVVKKGQLLLVIDTTEEELSYQKVQADYLKAQKQVEKLRHWSENPEVKSAQRELLKAQRTLKATERKLEENRRLLKRGIIAAQELEEAEDNYHNQQLDYQSSLEQVQALLAEGSEDKLQVAKLEMEIAHLNLQEIATRIQNARVVSPKTGVILLPPKVENTIPEIQLGGMLKRNQVLCIIANLDGFTIQTKVDEVVVPKLQVGQAVTITGEAFENINLTGSISHIASQAEKENLSEGIPSSFAITVAVPQLTPKQKNTLRLGMSAEMEVLLSAKPDALVVPFEAVVIENEIAWVMKQNTQNNQFHKVVVTTGMTTLESIEIVAGVKAGDKLLANVTDMTTIE
jgi:multidrug efflux pump subunit AcrA (membrane-fusion protein)